MTTSASVFAYTLRMLVCPNCGAPIHGPLEGGAVICKHCRAESVLTARRVEPERIRDATIEELGAAHAGPPDPETARLARLRAHGTEPTYSSVYDIANVPPDLLALANAPMGGNLEEARRAWGAARAELRPGATMEQQRRLFLLTSMLRNSALVTGAFELARAAAETALELLSDAGFRHVVRCMLANSAVRAGELDAAADWLETCDPKPDDLSLDTEVRLARASLELARGDFTGVLATLGQAHDEARRARRLY